MAQLRDRTAIDGPAAARMSHMETLARRQTLVRNLAHF